MMFSGFNTKIYSQCGQLDYPNDIQITSSNYNTFLSAFNNSQINFGGDVYVQAGVDIDISNAAFNFSSNSSFILESGAKVKFISSTLTSCDADGYWQGVQSLGDPNQLFQLNSEVTFRNTIIENAVIGASNFDPSENVNSPTTSGGSIIANNASFVNCNQAIVLGSYLHNNGHLFYATDFIWDDQFNFQFNDGFKPMIENFNNQAVVFTTCNVINTNADLFYSGTGFDRAGIFVKGSYAGLIYQGVTNVNSNFTSSVKGFAYGVYINSSAPPSKILDVDLNNFRDIYTASDYCEFRANNFGDLLPVQFQSLVENVTGSSDYPYGLYVNHATRYIITANDFSFNSLEYKDNGVIVNNGGADENLIVDNYFDGCSSYGVTSVNKNRSNGGSVGLSILCNKFSDRNHGDIYIHRPSGTPGTTANYGVKNIQSTAGGVKSAGNRFLSNHVDNNPANGFNIFNVSGEVGTVIYMHSVQDNLTEADGQVFPVSADLAVCTGLVDIVEGGLGVDDRALLMNSYTAELSLIKAEEEKVLAEAAQSALNSLVDGGDTDGLTMEVVLSDYSEALELYYELMSKSPNLSVKVMTEAINKETTLPSALLTMILKSNPTAAKSDEIRIKLDQRMNTLSEYQRYMIDQGKNLISQKEVLETNISAHLGQYNLAMDQGISAITGMNTAEVGSLVDVMLADGDWGNLDFDGRLNTLISFINGKERISDYYLVASLYLAKGDIIHTMDWMNLVLSNFDLSDTQLEEHDDLQTCMNIYTELMASSNIELSDAQFDILDEISLKEMSLASGKALGLMVSYGGYVLEEYVPVPMQDRSAFYEESIDPKKYFSSLKVQVYPNPATDYIVIDNPDFEEVLTAIINDAKGTVVSQQTMEAGGQLIMDVQSLKSGVYQLVLSNNQGIVLKEKLEIIK